MQWGVQVKAAPTYELVAVEDDVTYEEAKALVSDNPSSQVDNEADSAFISIIRELIPEAGLSSGNLVVFYNISTYGNINSAVWQSAYAGWTVMSGDSQYNSMKSSGFVYYYLVIHEDASQTPSSKPVKVEEPVHEHSYSWVTVQEATTDQDGIEEYRCSCGAVAERSDVTTVVTFEYNKTAYRLTIPAGADYSALLADEDYFYGYFYFAQLVGATIEEV